MPIPSETTYILNSFSFLIHGVLVMFMAAGFAMLEAGLVRTKNVATICLKNIALYSLAGVMFWLCGYNLMYLDVGGGFFGTLLPWAGDTSAVETADYSGEYTAHSDWFFQMVFVATTASIISGTIAERIKLWPFLLFVAVLAGFLYPIQGAWQWGGGWLAEMGFSDFAGSTIVHSAGGWAALAGAIIVGARKGKYNREGRINPIPGSSLPLATLGTFILWFGWFGFNGGSQLALGSAADATAISIIYANTNMAAAGGVLTVMALTQLIYKRVDLSMVLNGALAGLVSITAGPDTPQVWQAILIGGVGGIIVVFAVPLLDKLRIDDVVGAIPVHLCAGIWGTLAVPLTNPGAHLMTQLAGILAVGAFMFFASLIVWFIIDRLFGVRVSEEEEFEGMDKVELGLEAYPEFGQGSQKI
ncbi:MAG: ammonium transporter [Rhodospirillales bacterium]|jgi:ammonium transporter, Amt family|nr:ammonium transporter [Rhodospirillales bacterium]